MKLRAVPVLMLAAGAATVALFVVTLIERSRLKQEVQGQREQLAADLAAQVSALTEQHYKRLEADARTLAETSVRNQLAKYEGTYGDIAAFVDELRAQPEPPDVDALRLELRAVVDEMRDGLEASNAAALSSIAQQLERFESESAARWTALDNRTTRMFQQLHATIAAGSVGEAMEQKETSPVNPSPYGSERAKEAQKRRATFKYKDDQFRQKLAACENVLCTEMTELEWSTWRESWERMNKQ